MVVDAFEVFAFHAEAVDARVVFQRHGDVAYHVFHEFGVFVGVFGNVFFVGAFEQAIELARSFVFHQIDDFFNGNFLFVAGEGNGNVRALVVRAVLRNFLGAGAEAGNRSQYFDLVAVFSAGRHFALPGDGVVEK